MHRLFRATLLVAALCVALASATTAIAAPVTWKDVDVSLRPEAAGTMLLVSGTLPETTALPAEAELAVPTGSTFQWIGEILGGDPSADPEVQYVKSTANGSDIYRFTLTKARVAQVEVQAPAAAASDGANHVSELKWTAQQALPSVRMSVRIPQSAQIASAAPGAAIQAGDDAGFSYYSKTFTDVKVGDALDLTFAYTLPAAGAATSGSASGRPSDILVPVTIIAMFIGGFGLLIYNVRRKLAPQEEPTTKSAARTVASAKQPSGAKSQKSRAHEPAPSPEPSQPKKIKPALVVTLVVGVFVIGAVVAGASGTTAKVVDGKISKSFGAASPCTKATIPIMANQGVDLGRRGDAVVDAFTGVEGVGDVILDLASSTIEVNFCESLQTEDSVRQVLSGTGLVALGAAPVASAPATATLDASGKVQTAAVDTANGAFAPGQIALKAGVPTELSFGAAVGCVTEVIFAELGVKQNLEAGPSTVKLPALKPGTYAFACPMGHQTGELVVE